jgi:hypothetical protein
MMVTFNDSIVLAEPEQWRAADGGNDHWYEVVINRDALGRPAAITWENAKAAADARAGNWHLATITSERENDFVFRLLGDPDCRVIENNAYYGPWIGAYRYYQYVYSYYQYIYCKFLWVNGEPFSYDRWWTGEPSGDGENYVHFFSRYQWENTWNDLSDDNSVLPVAYIIETSDQNQPPVLDPIRNQSVAEGQTLAFSISASDADGDNLTFAVANLPKGAYFNRYSQQFEWTTDDGDAGNYQVTFTVTDDGAVFPLSDSETVTITVGDVNQPPVLAAIGTERVDVGAPIAFTVRATDPDSGNLNYSVDNLPAGATFNSKYRVFSWATDAADTGNYRVTFTVTDDGSPSLTDSETVPITVGDVNQPPVMGTIGNRAVSEGELLEFRVTATDMDSDSLFFDAGDLPAGASFDPVTHIFSWQPTYEYAGNHFIIFTVTDSGSPPLGDSETVIITVGEVNRPPVVTVNQNQSVGLGELLEFAISAFDSDNNSLSLSVDNLPLGASFNEVSRTLRWMPVENSDVGNHLVTFSVTDDGLPALTDSKQVTITVGNVNRAPIIGDIGGKVVETDKLLVFAVTATDPDNDTLEFSVKGLPTGAVFDETRQLFYWMPTTDDIGFNILKFAVVDNGTPPLSDEVVVDVEVTAAADTVDNVEKPAEQTPESGITVKGGNGGGCFIGMSVTN